MNLSEAANLLNKGNVVAFPTETVYGLGARWDHPEAIDQIFSLKGRPNDNPLIVHVSTREQLDLLAVKQSDLTNAIIDHFWPGPVSIVFPKRATVLDRITAGLPTVAVRMPNHPLALQLIDQTGPLVAPSANISGRPSPTKAEHVTNDFNCKVPVLDGGPCFGGLESTVLEILDNNTVRILRPGLITEDMLKKTLDVLVTDKVSESEKNEANTPGMRYSHYKPDADIHWWNGNFDDEGEKDQSSSLYIKIEARPSDIKNLIHLAGFDVLANSLYDLFRSADIRGIENVFIEQFERDRHPLAPALINRIDKAVNS